MASDLFKLSDKRYLIAAYAGGATHGSMGVFESGLQFTAMGSNKVERATSTINYLFKQRNTDDLVIELLNFLFVENPYANTTSENANYEALRAAVLEPRGIRLTVDGFMISPPAASLTASALPEPSPPLTQSLDHLSTPSAEATGTGTVAKPVAPTQTPSSKTVFVVHGRDRRPVDAIETFLMFLGLTMMTWSEAVKLSGETQPHTYDVVKAGMDGAAAVIVIFSPDDEATVKSQFAAIGERQAPQGQARQNVLVEAGMAFAQSRKKTIFVQSETTRPITDLEGFNWVNLDGNWDSRQDLINRLEKAGAEPSPAYQDLNHRTAGLFKVATDAPASPQAPPDAADTRIATLATTPMQSTVSWTAWRETKTRYRLRNDSTNSSAAAKLTGFTDVTKGGDNAASYEGPLPVELAANESVPFTIEKSIVSPSVTGIELTWEDSDGTERKRVLFI